ncbi:MAG: hypothetical protein HC773_29965 [Scytonema sp. CRU_2_7]|nr:hypothetical protein [Scytonema sp. CRU_2_7]
MVLINGFLIWKIIQPNLDEQNEGFTVFGQVLDEEDFEPIKAIADLSTVNGGGAFSNVPLTDLAEPIDTNDLVFLVDILSSLKAWRFPRTTSIA